MNDGPFAGTAVTITNWNGAPKPAEPIYAKKTSVKTYIIDPTLATGPAFAEIGSYEPNRCRMAIIVIDAACALTLDSPNVPDAGNSITAVPNQGCYLPINVNAAPYELCGPDAMWIKALTANPTRVTVIKEYK